MALTQKNVVQHELIGLEVEVVAAKNRALEGIRGKIIDETRETIVVEEEGRLKRLMKSQITIKTKIRGEEILINGKILVGRPEERIKKVKRAR